MRCGAVTFAEVLKGADYRTLWVGKSGLGWVNTTGAPWNLGFDYFFGQPDQSGCHNMYPIGLNDTASSGSRATVFDNTTALYLEQNLNASRERCMSEWGGGCWYTHDAWTNKSLELLQAEGERIRGAQSRGEAAEPFAMYIAYTDPHAGGWRGIEESGAPVPSDGSYISHDGSWPNVEMDHASVISNFLDRDVGRIVDTIRAAGLEQDTIVFFASDNGAHNEGGHNVSFFKSSGPLRGYKRSLFEGGMRTPSWIRWPGTLEPRETDEPWAFWDVLPTFADLAGAPRSSFPADIDGESIVPLLEDNGQYNASGRPFYFEFCTNIEPWTGEKGSGWTHSVRQGDWKVVTFKLGGKYQLYNLAEDLGEQHDLADQHPDIVARLAALAQAQHTESALFPSANCHSS